MMQNQLYRYACSVLAPLIIYLMVNGLFIVKYGLFDLAGNAFLFAVFAIITVYLLFIVHRNNLSEITQKYFFWTVVPCFFIFTLVINQYVELETLQVDRLDALDMGSKAVLNGEYPYSKPNRMGNESSNLPALILIGIPFYLIFGSAVYLQSFCFLLFSYIFYRYFSSYRKRNLALLLLVISPCYLYEFYVKSDLMSNFILAAGFVTLIWCRFIKSSSLQLPLVAVCSALLFMTRVPVIIPLVILFLKKWMVMNMKDKIIFASVFVVTIATVMSYFLMLATEFQEVIEHNPLKLQSKQPIYLSVILIATAVYFAFRVKSLFSIMLLSSVLLFGSVLITFILSVFKNGLYNTFYASYFDISHFNMAIPFVVISLALCPGAEKDYSVK